MTLINTFTHCRYHRPPRVLGYSHNIMYNDYMRLEYYPQDKLKKEISVIFGKYLDLKKYKIFFFGSRVSGKGNERSDIDIGIQSTTPIPAAALSYIEEDLDKLPILYKIEVVDFSQVDTKFKQVALQKIELIN